MVDLKLDVKTHELKMPQLSSDQSKVREQNRIRQIAFKVRQKMPKDYKSYKMVAEHLLRNADRYKNVQGEVGCNDAEMKKEEICKSCVKMEFSSREKSSAEEESCTNEILKTEESVTLKKTATVEATCESVNKILREIKCLKKQNSITEQQEKFFQLKNKISTYREIARMAGVAIKSVHDWCSIPKK